MACQQGTSREVISSRRKRVVRCRVIGDFLRVGVTGKSAVDLARELLTTFGSLNGIFAASIKYMRLVHGIGERKYAQLQAIFEMSRRALAEQMRIKDVLSSPQQVRDYLCLKLGVLPQEVF